MTASIKITGCSSTPLISAPDFSLSTMLTVWKERRELARMDVSRLSDLGISPIEAATEAARPFWDLPKCPR